MKLTIDNFDGAGARDYTGALDAERPPRILLRLNRPGEMRAFLYACGGEFVVPAPGARIVLARNDGEKLFTGYVCAGPEHEYLGWGERGPAYRYAVRAESDDSILSRRTLPERADFVQRAAGEALRILANDLAPGAFDVSGCEDVCVLPEYFPDPRWRFYEHAAELGRRSRAAYRAHDGRLSFRPVGATVHELTESTPLFVPDALKLAPSATALNDVTISGEVGPAEFVKDYFQGDGATLGFYLSETPFLRPGVVIVDEEYRGAMLSPRSWSVADPASAIAVSQGSLRVNGGTGALGATRVDFVEKVELAGALVLDHGDFEFTGPSDGIAGGLFNGGFGVDACIAGFRLTLAGTATQIAAVVGGVAAGQTLTTTAGRSYALSTRIYASEPYRMAQIFASPGGTIGGGAVPSAARILLLAQERDPNDPASLLSPATVLYEGWLPDVPACCNYAVVNAASMQASVSYTRLARLSGAEVRTSRLFGAWHDRLEGAMTEGGECRISGGQLRFYPASAPGGTESIVVRYRARARAIARVIDPDGIAALAHGGDDGRRSLVAGVSSPAARTFEDSENAARALLNVTQNAEWTGEYACRSNTFAEPVLPGDALALDVPSRAPAFTAVVREVEIEADDLLDDCSRYQIRFATESAAPIAMEAAPAARLRLPEAIAVADLGRTIAAAAGAEIVDIASTQVMIDTGAEPEPGGGFEVRRGNSGWGLEDDRTLIGRFTSRTFTVARLSRSQTWYLRPFDAAGNYSRVSTVLHVDCAL